MISNLRKGLRMLFFVRLIAAIVWAVLGLILWVPMIVRAFAVQTGALLLSALTDTDTAKYDAWFSRVLQFYPNGFVRIFSNESLTGSEDDDIKIGRALFEVFFALLFYGATIFAYYSVFSGTSPFRGGFFDALIASVGGEDQMVLEYRNASVVQDYQTNHLFSSTPSGRSFACLDSALLLRAAIEFDCTTAYATLATTTRTF